MVGFLSRRHSGKGPNLTLRGESPGFSQILAGNLGFLSSYDGDLRDPLVGPQGVPVSTQVARVPWGFLCSLCPGRGPHLEWRSEPVFPSRADMDLGIPLGRPQGSQGLVSCGAMQVHSSFDPEKQL